MNVAAGVIPCSLELLNWRAHIALEMWKVMLPKHFTRIDERIWRRFSEAQALRRGFEVRNGGTLRVNEQPVAVGSGTMIDKNERRDYGD